jgi:hypothetical protein
MRPPWGTGCSQRRPRSPFLTKYKKQGRTVTTTCTTAEFIARLAEKVPDRYRHGVRYFGVLAPQSIGKSYEVFLALLGEQRPSMGRLIDQALFDADCSLKVGFSSLIRRFREARLRGPIL